MTSTTLALGERRWPVQVAAVIAGTALIALAARVTVPFFPVPMTLQTLAILTIGLLYGPRLGAATLLAYLAEGAAGLPVFAGGNATAAFVGPTAGFLVGFVAMAAIAGLAAGRGLAVMVGAALAASAVLYVFGLAWPFAVASAVGIQAGWASLAPDAMLGAFMTPFLLGDAVKAVLAALIASGTLAALRRRA